MFLPFISIILALAGISVIGTLPPLPSASVPSGWALVGFYLSLLLPGLATGLTPRRWLGGYSPMGFTRRRLTMLVLWLGMLGTVNLFPALEQALGAISGRAELTLLVLLLNFWVAEALALLPWDHEESPPETPLPRIFFRILAVPLPLMVMVVLGFGVTLVLELLVTSNAGEPPWPEWMEMVGLLGIYLLLAGLVVPWLIPMCWRLRPLADADAEELILEELRASGVQVSKVLSWPEEMLGHATAGVIGLLPRFRYLLFSARLSGSLTPSEIRSVTAHEAGHLRHHHLWYFMAAMAGFLVLSNILLRSAMLAGLWAGTQIPAWVLLAAEVGLLLMFLRFGLGYLSRYFERQADGHALARLGLLPFQGAITKLGGLNGIPYHADNWHHHGIRHRVEYLTEADQNPEILRQHDRRVTRVKRGVLALLGLALVGQTVFSGSNIVTFVLDQHWLEQLDTVTEASPREVATAHLMASRAYARGDHAAAERFFRLSVRWQPEDPTALNNLAWLLVTAPPHSNARTAEGLEMAERAARASRSAFIWDTLAEAYARANLGNQARESAREALRLAMAGKELGQAPVSYYQDRVQAFAAEGSDAER